MSATIGRPPPDDEGACPTSAIDLMALSCADPVDPLATTSMDLLIPRTMSFEAVNDGESESLSLLGTLFLPTSTASTSAVALPLSSFFTSASLRPPPQQLPTHSSPSSSPPSLSSSSSSSPSPSSPQTTATGTHEPSPAAIDRVRSILRVFSQRWRRRWNTTAVPSGSGARRTLDALASMAKDISRALFLLGLLTCVILFGVHLSAFQHLVIGFLHWIRTLGMAGGMIYILVTAFSNLIFFPTTLATLASGYMFGLWFGFVFAYAGCCLGAVVAFLLGRTLFRSWVSSLAKQYPKVALMDQAIGKKAVGWKIVLLLRLSPMLPYNVLNYVLSVTRVRFLDYFVSSVIGMFPGIAVFTYFGSLSHDLSSLFSFSKSMEGVGGEDQTVIIYSGFFLSVLAFILLSYFSARAIKKELRKVEEENEENEKKDRALDHMELQPETQNSVSQAREVADDPVVVVGRPISQRQIDEALIEARKDSNLNSCKGAEVVVSSFEQNRSCGMRKNLSWVDASMA